MVISTLLQQVETLTAVQRFRFMVHLGRTSLMDIDLSSTLQELAGGDFYERYLLIQSCYGSRNSAHVLHFLRDPSFFLRQQAVKLVPLACSGEQIGQALELADQHTYVHLLKRLKKYAFQEQIDAFLEALAKRDERQGARLLSYGSQEVVERLLPQVLSQFTLDDWARLVRRQPDMTLALLRKNVQGEQEPHYIIRSRLGRVLPFLARSRPDATLQLVKELRGTPLLENLSLDNLLRERPNEVIDFLLEEKTLKFSEDELVWIVRSITFDRLLRFAEGGWLLKIAHGPWPGRWLSSLRPEQRGILYEQYLRYWHDSEGRLDSKIVAMLPRPQREREGVRHLALPEAVSIPYSMLSYMPFLPWEQAYAALSRYFRHVDIAMRGLALQAFATTVCYHREHLEDLLTVILAHKNDPDSVRHFLFQGLNQIPPGTWLSQHFPLLDSFLQTSLEASDLSAHTTINLTLLVMRLVPFQTDWSTSWLAKIMREHGSLPLNWMDLYTFSQESKQRVIAALQPIFDVWEHQERLDALHTALRGLRNNLELCDGLIANIERLMQKVVSVQICEEFLSLLSEGAPEQARRLIPLLLNDDPSWIMLRSVSIFVQRYRQDLLTPFLQQDVIRGRFSTGELRFVLSSPQHFMLWTKQQQEAFARQQLLCIEDQTLNHARRANVLILLSQLPAFEPTVLLATAQEENHPLQAVALQKISSFDGYQEQSAQVLLKVLQRDDERSREAMYAFRRLLKRLSPLQAFEVLRAIPLRRVTIAKEVFRLLGELELEEAYQHLLSYQSEELHQDVYAAQIRALWGHLDRAETWLVLEQASHQTIPAVVLALGHFPISRVSFALQVRWLGLLKIILETSDAETRLLLLSCCAQYTIDDEAQILTPRLLELMQATEGNEYQTVVNVFLILSTYRDVHLAEKTFEMIRADRQKIQVLADMFISGLWEGWYKDISFIRDRLPLIQVLLSVLKEDKKAAMLRAGLACRSLLPRQIVSFLINLAQSGQMHPGVFAAIYAVFQTYGFLLLSDGQEYVERQLSVQEDARLRAIGFCVLKAQPPHPLDGFWTPERIARLQVYRNDPAPMVAELAQFTFVFE